MGLTDRRANLWLDQLSTLWVSLHFENPDVGGHYASEVFGGSYQRIKVKMTPASSRAVFSAGDAFFQGLPAVKITHIGGWDNQFTGNLEVSIALPSPVTVLAGKSFLVSRGALAFSL